MVRSFFAYESGQGLVEYGLILVFIAVVVVGIMTLIGNRVSSMYTDIERGFK